MRATFIFLLFTLKPTRFVFLIQKESWVLCLVLKPRLTSLISVLFFCTVLLFWHDILCNCNKIHKFCKKIPKCFPIFVEKWPFISNVFDVLIYRIVFFVWIWVVFHQIAWIFKHFYVFENVLNCTKNLKLPIANTKQERTFKDIGIVNWLFMLKIKTINYKQWRTVLSFDNN